MRKDANELSDRAAQERASKNSSSEAQLSLDSSSPMSSSSKLRTRWCVGLDHSVGGEVVSPLG